MATVLNDVTDMSTWPPPTTEEVLGLWNRGIISRGELVSALAQLPECPLTGDISGLKSEVAALRHAILTGKSFVIGPA